MKNTKEQIKNRMLKKAATLWGVPANEIEMSFDPLVALLISACASEIEKISGEINESQTRITEKIIQLMTPETIYGPKPAHGVMSSFPIDDRVEVKPETLFYYKKKITTKKTTQNFKNLYFTPVAATNLIKATVNYIAVGDTIKTVKGKNDYVEVLKTSSGTKLPQSTIYLGIESDNKSLDLSDIAFYFELLDIDDKALFYHHLKFSEWYIADQKLTVQSGFINNEQSAKLDLDAIFEDVPSKTNNIVQQTCNFYNKHFIKVVDAKGSATFKASKFEELENIILDNKVKIDSNIRWIKIVFPRVIANSTLSNVFGTLNAFPILNRELNSFSYMLKEFISIIPVKTDDLFLDINTLTNTNGFLYKPQSKDNTIQDKGTYTIRTENVGKLDYRKAKEYVVYLLELLKDESASFSMFNNDFLQSNLKELNQLIARLEKKVSEITKEVSETTYLNLKPFKVKETLLVEYWTTNGKLANNLKTGNALEIYKGIGIKQKSSILLTPTHGGKDHLSMEERLNAYRRSLLSRNRIVTKEDIKALCYEIYNNKITAIDIRKNYIKDIAINKGLIQCIEIVITPNTAIKTDEQEWDALNSNLLLFLENHSVSVFPYKIRIL
ncbi:type VI secretion system baseplate subunit TssF [Lacinutrix chionoecetis]